jgi:hypothetical protein
MIIGVESDPQALAFGDDAQGRLAILDADSFRVRKVRSISGAMPTTVTLCV